MDPDQREILLQQVTVGDKVEIYWSDDDEYYCGVVSEHKPATGGEHAYSIHYDDGDIETVNLADPKERFRIVKPIIGEPRLLLQGEQSPTSTSISIPPPTKMDPDQREILLQQVSIGDKVEIYWSDDDEYYCGVVSEHKPATGGEHAYSIHYDDGDIETVNLADPKERFRIVNPIIGEPRLLLQGEKPKDGDDLIYDAFLEDDFEIYWGYAEGNVYEGWRPFLPDMNKIKFYSYDFDTKSCEVEWNGKGVIYKTKFRPASKKRKRKSSQKRRDIVDYTSTARKSVQKPKQEAMDSEQSSEDKSEQHQHHITDTLGMTKEEVLFSLPELMRERFHDCVFIEWKKGNVKCHRPALIISPFDLSGSDGMVEKWVQVYRQRAKEKGLGSMAYLVYWYEEGWSESKDHKAYSLTEEGSLVSYEVGMTRRYDKPKFYNKVHNYFDFGELTDQEDRVLRGIEQMKIDQGLQKDCRGGPTFFPHLREEEKQASKEAVKRLEEKYSKWTDEVKYRACVELGESPHRLSALTSRDSTTMFSLELCAGEEVMSRALGGVGFRTTTLDNDLNRSATSNLSLNQVEDMIVNRQMADHPHLYKPFSVIWAGPECRTWSKAQNGRYRNANFIDGYLNRAQSSQAEQARKDIESLVNILSFYKRLNPAVKIVIENPVGYLHQHPVSTLFKDILGLEMSQISYCRFSTDELYPRKNTHLWTNSSILLMMFNQENQYGENTYVCQNESKCKGIGPDGKHVVQTQDLSDKCSAYPRPMCSFIAPLLKADAIQDRFT